MAEKRTGGGGVGKAAHWARRVRTNYGQEAVQKDVPLKKDADAEKLKADEEEIDELRQLMGSETQLRSTVAFALAAFAEGKKATTAEDRAKKFAMRWKFRASINTAKAAAAAAAPQDEEDSRTAADAAPSIGGSFSSLISGADANGGGGSGLLGVAAASANMAGAAAAAPTLSTLGRVLAGDASAGVGFRRGRPPALSSDTSIYPDESTLSLSPKKWGRSKALQSPVTRRELVEAQAPERLTIGGMLTVSRRSPGSMPTSHYEFFAKQCPDTCPEHRKAMQRRSREERNVYALTEFFAGCQGSVALGSEGTGTPLMSCRRFLSRETF